MPEILSTPSEHTRCIRTQYFDGVAGPTVVQCQLEWGHDGLHSFTVTWKDPRDA